TIKNYPSIRKDWYEAGAFVLQVLPRELNFLYANIFRCPRAQFFAWLLNIGHGIVTDLLNDLKSRVDADSSVTDFGCLPEQLPLEALLQDEVGLPILEKATHLETVVEYENPAEILVRYLRKF